MKITDETREKWRTWLESSPSVGSLLLLIGPWVWSVFRKKAADDGK